MAYPVLTNGAQLNNNSGGSVWQVRVAAADPLTDLLAASAAQFGGTKKCSCGIIMCATGRLDYTNPYGVTVSLLNLPAGYWPFQAQAIEAATDQDVIACF